MDDENEGLLPLIRLHRVTAQQNLNAILSLGPRPHVEPEAIFYDQQLTRLKGQVESHTGMVGRLSAIAIINSLADFSDEVEGLKVVSLAAEERIVQIKKVSKLLTVSSKVLDLGLAVLALAAAPSVALGLAAAQAAAALQSTAAEPLDEDVVAAGG